MQVKSEQLAKETGELEALRQQLLQRERELSLRAAEQSSEGATLKVGLMSHLQPRLLQPSHLELAAAAVGPLQKAACHAAGQSSGSHSRAAAGVAGAFFQPPACHGCWAAVRPWQSGLRLLPAF